MVNKTDTSIEGNGFSEGAFDGLLIYNITLCQTFEFDNLDPNLMYIFNLRVYEKIDTFEEI